MAQPFPCDYEGCPNLADVIISRVADGETQTWCDLHFLAMCQAIVDNLEAQAVVAGDDAAIALLEAAGEATIPPTSGESSGEAPAAPGEPGRPVDGPDSSGVDSDATPDGLGAPGASDEPTEAAPAPA